MQTRHATIDSRGGGVADPVTREIINGKLLAIADEMAIVLARASMSPVVYEVLDFACGICDGRGDLIAQTNGITIFQDLGLFPHMTVADNVAYGLRIRGIDAAARDRRVRDMLGIVALEGYESRRVHQLSGGQRQRVALARALVLAVRPSSPSPRSRSC